MVFTVMWLMMSSDHQQKNVYEIPERNLQRCAGQLKLCESEEGSNKNEADAFGM